MESAFLQIQAGASSGNPKLRRVAALLESVTDVIRREGGSSESGSFSSAVSYFGALMATLEQADSDCAADALHLLAIVVPHVPLPALQRHCDTVFQVIDTAFMVSELEFGVYG